MRFVAWMLVAWGSRVQAGPPITRTLPTPRDLSSATVCTSWDCLARCSLSTSLHTHTRTHARTTRTGREQRAYASGEGWQAVGRDGTGRDGTGRDGTGRDGTGRDVT